MTYIAKYLTSLVCRFVWIYAFRSLPLQAENILKPKSIPIPQSFLDQKSFPPNDMIISHDDHLWITGPNGVEILSLKDQLHQKMKLTDTPIEHLLERDSQVIIAVHSKEFFLIQKEPLNVKKFILEKSYPTLGLQLGKDGTVYWIRTDGVYSLAKGEDSLSYQSHSVPNGTLKAIFDVDQKRLVCLSQDQIFFQTSKSQWKSVLEKKSDVLNIFQMSNQYWIASFPYQTLVLSQNGDIIQSIPIASQKSLINALYSHEFHSYLFHDGLLEINDMQKKRTYFFMRQSLSSSKKMVIQLPWMIFSGDKTLEVFQIEDMRLFAIDPLQNAQPARRRS